MERFSSKDFNFSKATELTDSLCQSCGSNGMSVFHESKNVPVHSVLNMATREQALDYPKGEISLGFCDQCGFISNLRFDPDQLEYSSNCEESQGFSPTFNEFSRGLGAYLIEKYDLHHKDILEIGCGKGEFLNLLCELGDNRGVGFDPAYVRGRSTGETAERITFIRDFYSEKYAGYQADFVCCKMTLEHIQGTADFVSTVRRSMGNRLDTVVFFQVPDVTRILRDCAFEDIYYEHCSYFTPGSLGRLFRNCGFNVFSLDTAYDGQYLMIEAKPANGDFLPPLPQENDLEELKILIESFQAKLQRKLSYWQERLQKGRTNGHRVVLWGSGSKGVAFLTTLEIYDEIKYVVDINRYRQGNYMAGTGQEIVAPGFLQKYRPDLVIIMNAVYRQEIEQDLQRMGLTPELLTI